MSDTKENILLKTNKIFWSGSSSGEEPGLPGKAVADEKYDS